MAHSSRSIAGPGPNPDRVSNLFTASSPPRIISKNKAGPLSRSPERSPSRIYGSISSQSSPPPPPPVTQPRRHTDTNLVILEPDMMEPFTHPSSKTMTTTHRPLVSQLSQPHPSLSSTAPVLSPSSNSAPGPVSTPTSRASTPLPPMVRGLTFVLVRILLFPKTVFVRGVVVGRGCLNRLGLTQIHRSAGGRRPHRHYHPHQQGRQRHHYRSYQQSSGSGPETGGSEDRLSSYRTRQQPRRLGHPASTSRSRSRSRGEDYPRLSAGSGRENGNGSSGGTISKEQGSCWSWFKNSYNVQVAMICLCLTGESFAQSVMCPFLYYMVRDFHVGPDIWIGYYAGLLWTGFWGANLCTTLLWGHLSDKYGRKTILLFGLFTTSMSTLGLGLSTCYHDAMWALVIQGACTGLVPVSKCSIGELANRKQRLHDAERLLAKAQMDGRLFNSEEAANEKSLDVEGAEELETENGVWCSDPDCTEGIEGHGSRPDQRIAPPVKAQVDYAAKGYSALVIALALGAALGPLAGGSLARKHIHGFDSYPYFAPCLLAASVGMFITGIVALMLNETNPKWSKPTEYENLLEVQTRATSMYLRETIAPPTIRGRSGYEQSRRYRETTGVASGVTAESSFNGGITCEDKTDLGEAEDKAVSTNETRSRLRLQEGTSNPAAACTCPPTAHSRAPSKVLPTRSILSPATELYLILTIYTLLVLTSILGSEFVMLYTQSPVLRGGLEFSAKALGQVLTMRGILKLTFNLFGYPWMVKRAGLLNCLRIGIVAIGSVSVLGLGWFVPWSVESENMRLSAIPGEEHAKPMGGSSERSPVGMTAILLCLSLISVGDVLGYISVLVLFGKSADRLKGGDRTVNTEGSNQQQGGSGVLWSVAQVSANVMRLTGPVLAGLLWSLTDKSPVSISTIGRGEPSFVGGSNIGSTQSTFSAPTGTIIEKIEFQESHGHFWAVAAKILRGSTSVFYLVGAICIVNFVASQILYLSTPSPSSHKVGEAGSSESQQHREHELAPQAHDYFLQPGYSSGLSQSPQQ